LRPGDGELNDGSALLNRLDGFEGSENHASLDLGIERRANVMAHGPRDENRTRNFDGCGHILSDRD
jgi:hypothetical protein